MNVPKSNLVNVLGEREAGQRQGGRSFFFFTFVTLILIHSLAVHSFFFPFVTLIFIHSLALRKVGAISVSHV